MILTSTHVLGTIFSVRIIASVLAKGSREPVEESALASRSSRASFQEWFMCSPTPPGRMQKVDPPESSRIYTIGAFESRTGGSTFWILLWGLGQKEGRQRSLGSVSDAGG